ncbi:MAG: GNAT family N-acetyltransferase [Sphingobacteriia bacterium]|nr:GNAT family N-acetyltransferase [Sphingobacteriia bacterium]
MIKIEIITPDLAEELCRKITVDLPEYFGLPEANEHYAIGVRANINLAAKIAEEYVGLISIDFPYPENANIYWLGILQKFHRLGIGKILTEAAFKQAKIKGAKTISVETLAPQESDANYLNTYKFYQQLGFSPLFNLRPTGYEWNMVYMVKSLDNMSPYEIKDIL